MTITSMDTVLMLQTSQLHQLLGCKGHCATKDMLHCTHISHEQDIRRFRNNPHSS